MCSRRTSWLYATYLVAGVALYVFSVMLLRRREVHYLREPSSFDKRAADLYLQQSNANHEAQANQQLNVKRVQQNRKSLHINLKNKKLHGNDINFGLSELRSVPHCHGTLGDTHLGAIGDLAAGAQRRC